ncbi:hypothetical protein V6N13_014166 [Hibiscus sabdariffa]
MAKAEPPLLNLIIVFVMLLYPKSSTARVGTNHCATIQCGNVNISHPFRLKSQPRECGDRRFELDCEADKNRTTLVSRYNKFQVHGIFYENSTLSVSYLNLATDNCSLPMTGRFYDDFPFCDKLYFPALLVDYGEHRDPYSYLYLLNCTSPVKSPIYVNADRCPNRSTDPAPMASFFYFLDWKTAFPRDFNQSCTVVGQEIPVKVNNITGLSTAEIYQMLSMGFELTWSPLDLGEDFCPHISFTQIRHLSADDAIEEFLKRQKDLMPIRYSYREIERMSSGFKDKLGEGGYGSVFKGKLRSGYFVAIKLLGKSKGNGQDFINEVATIGRIHHVNVAKLIGFCVKGSKQALVYDFMPNGSLDRILFAKENKVYLSWKKMFDIALGVARGIEYLHQGCDMQILHFDIKPHNILLDENFTPKVADFGLAKLYSVDDSIVSLTAARGTIGYIAPELIYKNLGGISYKADVYSFGMLLMEIIGRRKNLSTSVEHESQIYFPSWIYDRYYHGKEVDLGDVTDDEKVMVKKMVIIASWCVQLRPNNRPSMSKVLEMLDSDVELLRMPPQPYQLPFEVPTDQSHSSTKDRSHDNGSTCETSTLLYSSNEISIDVL